MPIVRKVTFIAFFFCLSTSSYLFAQTNELGAFVGNSLYAGTFTKDINDNFTSAHGAYGLYYRYHIGSKWTIKASAYAGEISGDGRPAKFKGALADGYYFTNSLYEFGLNIEYYPLAENPFNGRGFDKQIQPYFALGMGKTYNLLILKDKTGVQKNNTDASPYFTSYMIGMGARYWFDPKVSMSAEAGFRTILSDSLDGLRTSRGRDWYSMIGLSLSYFFEDNL